MKRGAIRFLQRRDLYGFGGCLGAGSFSASAAGVSSDGAVPGSVGAGWRASSLAIEAIKSCHRRDRAARLQLGDPATEPRFASCTTASKSADRGALLVEPPIQHLLHAVGGLSEFEQADHPATSL
jgi:hypothetical protein